MTYYYFLVASLPALQFNQKPPLSSHGLLERCQSQLAKEDYHLVDEIIKKETVKMKHNHHVLLKWNEFNHHFKNELAYFRAKRAGKDPHLYLRGARPDDVFFRNTIDQALQAEDPLSAEKVFDHSRWDYLDNLQRFEYFNMPYLICYALKLKILEKYEKIDSPSGRALFGEYKNIEVVLS